MAHINTYVDLQKQTKQLENNLQYLSASADLHPLGQMSKAQKLLLSLTFATTLCVLGLYLCNNPYIIKYAKRSIKIGTIQIPFTHLFFGAISLCLIAQYLFAIRKKNEALKPILRHKEIVASQSLQITKAMKAFCKNQNASLQQLQIEKSRKKNIPQHPVSSHIRQQNPLSQLMVNTQIFYLNQSIDALRQKNQKLQWQIHNCCHPNRALSTPAFSEDVEEDTRAEKIPGFLAKKERALVALAWQQWRSLPEGPFMLQG